MKRAVLFSTLVLVAGLLPTAQAQTLTFSAETVTGPEKVTPVLSWTTEPAAASCAASGASNWSGTKAASGSETLADITASQVYTLTCTWPGNVGADLTWQAPTTNTDGSALAICPADTSTGACLLKFRLSYGRTPDQLTTVKDIARSVRTWSLPGLSGGDWYFTIKAVTAQGVESAPTSPPLKKTTGSQTTTVNRSAGITVQPRPIPVPGFEVK